MRSFVVARMTVAGRQGRRSVGVARSWLPLGRCAGTKGPALIVVTDNDKAHGDAIGGTARPSTLGYPRRDHACISLMLILRSQTALADTEGGPAVIADMADNPRRRRPRGQHLHCSAHARARHRHGRRRRHLGSGRDRHLRRCRCRCEVSDFRVGGKSGPVSGDTVWTSYVEVKNIIRDAYVDSLGGSQALLWVMPLGFTRRASISLSIQPARKTPCRISLKRSASILDGAADSGRQIDAAFSRRVCAHCAATSSTAPHPARSLWDMTEGRSHANIARPVWPVDADPWTINEPRPWA